MWKNIDGFYYPLRINEDAHIEKQQPNGTWKRISTHVYREQGKQYGKLCVNLRLKDGSYKTRPVKKLMIDAFYGGNKPGVSYGFKNGSFMDCSLTNLYPATKEQILKRSGGHNRRPVSKIDSKGNVVEFYSSVSEAAKKNHLDRRSINRRCSRKTKRSFDDTGCTFRYER